MIVDDNQHNKISNENNSSLCSNILPNERLLLSNVVDLVERPSEIIGAHCIRPAIVANLTSFARSLRGTDKRSRIVNNVIGASSTMNI